jgi:hypothetical protein
MNTSIPCLAFSLLGLTPFLANASEKPDRQAPPPDPLQLPVFTSGEAKGLTALYRAKNFDARLTADRILTVQPKEDGKPVGQPFVVRFACVYVFDQRAVARDLVRLKQVPTPTLQPQKLRISGEYEENVKFQIDYQFSEDAILIQGAMEEAPKPKSRSTLQWVASFPPSHTIPAGTPEPELQKLTEGCVMKLRMAGGDTRSVGFWELLTSTRDVSSVEVSGPWSHRTILLEAPEPKGKGGSSGSLWNYSAGPVYKGHWAFGRTIAKKATDTPLVIQIK